jgi:hypothetical protein
VEWINVPKVVVDISDYLMKLQPFASPDGMVETEADWKIVVKLFEAFIRCYPEEYQAFILSSSMVRNLNSSSKGDVKGTDMRQQMEIPQKFHELLRVFYPLQDYDTKFSRRLAKELPALKATY